MSTYHYSRISSGAVAPEVVRAAEAGLAAEGAENVEIYWLIKEHPMYAELHTRHDIAWYPVDHAVWLNAALDADGAYACARGGAVVIQAKGPAYVLRLNA